MRTNIKVSLKETIDNPAYDKELALQCVKEKLEYNCNPKIDNIRTVDILLQGDTAIIQDIIKSIPAKYDIE